MRANRINIVWYFVLAIVFINIFFYVVKPGGEMVLTIVSDLLPVICSLITIVALWGTFKAFKVHDYTRTAWFLIFVGMIMNFLGESSYSYQEIILKVDLANIAYSISDLFWFSSYLFCITGLSILIRGYFKSDFPIGNQLHLTLVMLLLVLLIAILIVVLLQPIVKDVETPMLDKVVYLLYPIFDMIQVIIACALLFIVRKFKGGLVKAPWRLIAAGFLFMAVSDIMFSYFSWNDAYGSGNFIDLGWNAGYLLIAMAGLYQKNLVKSLDGGV